MSPVRMSLLGLAALTAAGCASVDPAGPPLPDAGAPEPIADHDWHLKQDEGLQVLSYGLSESDDVWLEMSCRSGTGGLTLAQYLPGENGAVVLESAGEMGRWPATSRTSELGDQPYLTATSRTDHALLQRFRTVGWLVSHGEDGPSFMVAHPGSGAQIDRFFAACG